jgi:hypothetical protein
MFLLSPIHNFPKFLPVGLRSKFVTLYKCLQFSFDCNFDTIFQVMLKQFTPLILSLVVMATSGAHASWPPLTWLKGKSPTSCANSLAPINADFVADGKFVSGEQLDLARPDDLKEYQMLKKIFKQSNSEQALIWLYDRSGQIGKANLLASEVESDLRTGQILRIEKINQSLAGRMDLSTILDGSQSEGNSQNVFIAHLASGREAIFRVNENVPSRFDYRYEIAAFVVDHEIVTLPRFSGHTES